MNTLKWHIESRYGGMQLGTPEFWLIIAVSITFRKDGLKLSSSWKNGEHGFHARKGKVMIGDDYV
jgi:hypothetical protein